MTRAWQQHGVRTALLAAADASALCFARPDPARLAFVVGNPSRALARSGADAVVVTCARTALWLVAAWVAIGLLALIGGAAPGVVGRICRVTGALIVPAVFRRLVIGTVGLGLLAGPATSALAAAPGVSGSAASAPAAAAGVPGTAARPFGAVPAPPWPGTPSPSGAKDPRPAPVPFPTTPPAPHHAPRSRHAPPGEHTPSERQPRTGTGGTDTLRVHPGDSLWLIASRRLGPTADESDVARYWPRIYAANRGVVGHDPDLLVPGQVLHLPVPDGPH